MEVFRVLMVLVLEISLNLSLAPMEPEARDQVLRACLEPEMVVTEMIQMEEIIISLLVLDEALVRRAVFIF
jgi:hypothetical protein